jgi:hypothetical protein
MAKHQPKKLPRDVNSRANAIGKIATGKTVLPEESTKVASGRKGGPSDPAHAESCRSQSA